MIKKLLFSVLVAVSACAEDFKFVWASDVHMGIPDKYSYGAPELHFLQMASFKPNFFIVTGDISDSATLDQTKRMRRVMDVFSCTPFWTLAGNHDACPECPDCATDCSESYEHYKALIDPNLHWVHDYGGLRFIGFDSRLIRTQPFLGFGKIVDAEFSWLAAALALSAADQKKVILCSHFPLLDDFGNNIKFKQAELLAQMDTQGNVVAYLGGHRHGWGHNVIRNGVTHINGPSTAYGPGAFDLPYSPFGGFFLVSVTGQTILFEFFANDEPNYTARPAMNVTVIY